jgi:hypothetical protein
MPYTISEELKLLIQDLMNKDQNERLGFEELDDIR